MSKLKQRLLYIQLSFVLFSLVFFLLITQVHFAFFYGLMFCWIVHLVVLTSLSCPHCYDLVLYKHDPNAFTKNHFTWWVPDRCPHCDKPL